MPSDWSVDPFVYLRLHLWVRVRKYVGKRWFRACRRQSPSTNSIKKLMEQFRENDSVEHHCTAGKFSISNVMIGQVHKHSRQSLRTSVYKGSRELLFLNSQFMISCIVDWSFILTKFEYCEILPQSASAWVGRGDLVFFVILPNRHI